MGAACFRATLCSHCAPAGIERVQPLPVSNDERTVRVKKFSILCLCSAFLAVPCGAQGPAFTYQGVLATNGVAVSGPVEVQFTLWNSAANPGSPVASNTPAVLALTLTNGLLTVPLDFGAAAFDGSDRWLQIELRSTLGPFTTLAPRQKITSTPYAIRAANLTGTVAGNSLAGTYGNAVTFSNAANAFRGSFNGDGAAVSNVNAASLGGLSAAAFWTLNGNTGADPLNGAFLGTSDLQPLELRVGNVRALRLEPKSISPNIIGGYRGNFASNGVEAATIGGGGAFLSLNVVGANAATVAGGAGNVAEGLASAVAGGSLNRARGQESTIGGGHANQASGTNATVGGGTGNSAIGLCGTVPGGADNTATNFAFAAGRRAKSVHEGAFVWTDAQDADFFSTGTNQFRVRASGGLEIVGGSNQPAFHYSAARTGGFGTPVGLAENLNATGVSAPALRVVNASGNSVDGALSVSVGGTGYIAKFGNASAFVADLTTNGTFSAVMFNPTSDRNAKENFSPVDAGMILEKVAALPISRWNFRSHGSSEHIGPMAQDFHAAFGLNGEDDTHIATVDADGVALAAIQGLNQKLTRELKHQEEENAERKRERAELKKLLQQIAAR